MPIDQNCIHIGTTPDQYRTSTVAPRPAVADWDEISLDRGNRRGWTVSTIDRRSHLTSRPFHPMGWLILFLRVRLRSLSWSIMAEEEFAANPQQVLAEAVQEPRRRGLADYQEAIRVLKEEKDFSFRDIAVWLQQRGLKVDHNAVWRAYSKASPEETGRRASQRSERSERPPAREDAMPWMEGA